jgi:hypothetical protein
MDRHGVRGGNRVRQMNRVMAADAPDGNEDLVMMRIIGDAREGEPGRGFLVTEVSTHDLQAGCKTMMFLRKIIQEGFPVRLLNVLGHRISPSMLAPGETVMYLPGAPPWSPQYSIEDLEQVLCQFFVSTCAA